MMRPKFTIASLLILTTIVAMAVVIFGSQARIDQLKALLARHEAVRAQALLVHQRQVEFDAASRQIESQLESAALYGINGFGDSSRDRPMRMLAGDKVPAWQSNMEFNMPVGYRLATSHVQNAQLRLARDQAVLSQLEQELRRTQSEFPR